MSVSNARHISRDDTPIFSAHDLGVSGPQADVKRVRRFGISANSLFHALIRMPVSYRTILH